MYSFICIPYYVFVDHEVAWQFMYMIWIWYNMECEMASTSFWLRILMSGQLLIGSIMYLCLCEYVGHFMNDWRLIYGRLITYVTRSFIICFELWTCYPDILIGLWLPTLWMSFSYLFRTDHLQQGHLSSCDFYIALLCRLDLCCTFFFVFIIVIVSLWSHLFIFISLSYLISNYDHVLAIYFVIFGA